MTFQNTLGSNGGTRSSRFSKDIEKILSQDELVRDSMMMDQQTAQGNMSKMQKRRGMRKHSYISSEKKGPQSDALDNVFEKPTRMEQSASAFYQNINEQDY